MWPREERWGHTSWSWFLREGGPNPPPPTHTPVKLLPLLFGDLRGTPGSQAYTGPCRCCRGRPGLPRLGQWSAGWETE